MKAYVVKSKSKLGKLPDKKILKELLDENSFDRKLETLGKFYPDLKNLTNKIEVEHFLNVMLDDNINSFLHFLNGKDKELFERYVTKYEIAVIQNAIQAILNNSVNSSISALKANPFSKNVFLEENMTFEKFVLEMKNTQYYRTLLPFLNENNLGSSMIFLVSNSLNKFYYRNLLEYTGNFPKAINSAIKDYLGKKIDLFNLEILYRLLSFFQINSYEIFNYLIEGGKYFKVEKLKELSEYSIEGFKKEILKSEYKNIFNDDKKDFYQALNYEKYKVTKTLSKSNFDILFLIYTIETMEVSNRNIVSILELDDDFSKNEKEKFMIKR